MSNYFPDGRPIQKMMIALNNAAVMTAISPTGLSGNVLQELKADFVLSPTNYPGYTADSFNEMLSKANIMQIMSDESGKYGLLTSSNAVFAPLTTHGGAYIYGAETIRKITVSNCQVILYIKPTP